ncbi:glycosyltransferase [Actinoallomurus purpureus]|uniref:glycosyltransferase family 2 protein n=1 Tax=Actinoallomurus purpureus TaxID=478114 RepID=UPI0020927FD7|nr:glycosyltransferase [Actinoallomurus purpureus]MCO6008544.1 glycosyltransferase [Actinoallomurus purpureus]
MNNGDMNSKTKFAVVVTTIGRPELLDHLLASIHAQTLRPSEVVVVDQSSDDGTRTVVASWADRLPVRRLTSARGASVGRNVGVAALGDCDFVAFPDDDTSYLPDTLAQAAAVLTRAPSAGGVSGRSVGTPGRPAQLTSFGDRQMPLNHRTVWTSAIEHTVFLRRDFIRAVGGFDEDLGVGAASPWQSGEGTDLLLRGLKAGWTILFDPQIIIVEYNPDAPSPGERAYHIKARRYARGTGRVYRAHHGLGLRVRVVFRPLAAAALSIAGGRWALTIWYLQRAIGRIEGLTGLVLPGPRD